MGNQQVSLCDLYPIPFFDGYFHDNMGNIYSNRRGKLRTLKIINHGGKTKKVYHRVKVNEKLWMVHHLVLVEKYGRLLSTGESGNHLDGDTTNNCRENLEIATHAEQVAHAVENGLYCSGEQWKRARGYQ